jgi:uncharacterized membrane protein YwzB
MEAFLTGINKDLFKPLAGAGIIFAIDKYYNKEQDYMRSAKLAGSVGLGFFVGTMLGQYLPDNELELFFSNGRNVQERLMEIIGGAGSAYAVNKFILKNELNRDSMQQKLMEIIVADLIAESLSEFMINGTFQIM